MVRLIKTIGAVLISLAILKELGWIVYVHPKLEQLHEILMKGIRLILYIFFP